MDYQFVEVNPAFERQTGVDLHGKWVTEFAPELERFWFDAYGHVAKTGEPASFESYAQAFGRWFDVRAVRVGAPADRRIAILFNDVTQRHDAEDRLRVSESWRARTSSASSWRWRPGPSSAPELGSADRSVHRRRGFRPWVRPGPGAGAREAEPGADHH